MIHDSHAHRVNDALGGLRDGHLAYSPIPKIALDWQDDWRSPCVQTPRRILMHIVSAAVHYSNGLVGETGAESASGYRARHLAGIADSAEALVARLDEALAQLHERAATLADADLYEPARETWDGTKMKGFVLIDGAILHTAWHLGQVGMLVDWHAAQADGHALAPPAGPPGEFRYPRERDWTDLHLVSRRDALLRLARAAYCESPTQSVRPIVEGMAEHEMAWRPFPEIESIWFCRAMWLLCVHMWSPKIVYIDHAFGERRRNYGEDDGNVAAWGDTDSERQLGALDQAHEFLMDHVSRATGEELDRIDPMHIDHPMTGWQAAVCMAQHDAWHGGQLSIMRDVYRALWEARQP